MGLSRRRLNFPPIPRRPLPGGNSPVNAEAFLSERSYSLQTTDTG